MRRGRLCEASLCTREPSAKAGEETDPGAPVPSLLSLWRDQPCGAGARGNEIKGSAATRRGREVETFAWLGMAFFFEEKKNRRLTLTRW